MEVSDELEVRLVKTARLIRHFNAAIEQLRQYGATSNVKESERMRDELVAEWQQLTQQMLVASTPA